MACATAQELILYCPQVVYNAQFDELSAGSGLGNLLISFKPACQSISALRRPWCVSAIAPSWKGGFPNAGGNNGMVRMRG